MCRKNNGSYCTATFVWASVRDSRPIIETLCGLVFICKVLNSNCFKERPENPYYCSYIRVEWLPLSPTAMSTFKMKALDLLLELYKDISQHFF